MFRRLVPVLLLISLATSSCVLTPRGTAAERERLAEVAPDYDPPAAERALPELPPQPGWRDLLHHAFLANGDLEAAYFEWKAALARIDVDAGWPNTNLALGYQYAFSPGQMKTWDRSTLSVGVDPMQNLSLPPKVMAKGAIALEEARATGRRFEQAKFALQRQVIEAWFAWAATAEKLRLAHDDEALTRALAAAATARLEAGGLQSELVAAETAHIEVEDTARRMSVELRQQAAALNALAGRAYDAPLEPPAAVEPRPLAASDDALLALAVDRNPELAALASEVDGRDDALDYARMQYLPDINPLAAFTGNSVQMVGAVFVLSTQLPQIWAGIDEAKAMLRRSQAMLAQRRRERGAAYVAALWGLRDAERQLALFRDRLLPAAEMAQRAARLEYEGGARSLGELIEAERAPLQVRALIADAVAAREARLAEMEELAGVDVETLPSTTAHREPSEAHREASGVRRFTPHSRTEVRG